MNDPLMTLAEAVETNTRSIGKLRELVEKISEIQTEMIRVLECLVECEKDVSK